MKKLVLILVILISYSFLESCSKNASTDDLSQSKSIAFQTRTGQYFLKNTYEVKHRPTFFIINQFAAFENLFGWGATMQQNSSNIIQSADFESNFVLDIVIQDSSTIEIAIQKITLKDSVLSVYYTTSQAVPHPSFTSNNHTLATVSKCNYNIVKFYENNKLIDNPHIEKY